MMTPTAPAACALYTLVEKSQVPRSINARSPASEPSGISPQPKGSPDRGATSRNGAVVLPGCGPSSLACAGMFWRVEETPEPVTSTAEPHVWPFQLPAAAMAEGASPGLSMVFCVGKLV